MTASDRVGLSEKCCLSPTLTNTSAVSSRLDITCIEVGTVIRYTWDTIHRASGTPGHLAPRRGVTLPWPRLRRRTPRATPSATTAVAGARTDMHLAVFNLQHTQHIRHIAFRWSVNKTPRTFRIIFVRTNTNEKKYDNGEVP